MRGLPRRFWAGMIGVVVVTAAVVSTATVAVATHTFPDVSDNSPFHTEVGNIVGAGIATGFPDNTFRPKDPVNRQQFAAWMNRGGGRVEWDSGTALNLTNNAPQTVASITIEAGAADGSSGHGYVLLTATLDVLTTDADSCPCRVTSEIVRTNDAVAGPTRFATIPGDMEDQFGGAATLASQWLVQIEAGQTRTFDLKARFIDADLPGATAGGELSAVYVPFRGDGGNDAVSGFEVEDRQP